MWVRGRYGVTALRRRLSLWCVPVRRCMLLASVDLHRDAVKGVRSRTQLALVDTRRETRHDAPGVTQAGRTVDETSRIVGRTQCDSGVCDLLTETRARGLARDWDAAL